MSNSSLPEPLLRAIDRRSWVITTGWEHFGDIIESPIERLLFAEIYASTIGLPQVTGLTCLGREYIHGEDRFLTGHGIICYPQGHIGQYRADFVFDCLFPFSERTIYVVECDGHDFHEKTKDQAQRDKQRDRFMTSRGINVLRFTGSEIFRNAEMVWREIVGIITDGHGEQWDHPTALRRPEAA